MTAVWSDLKEPAISTSELPVGRKSRAKEKQDSHGAEPGVDKPSGGLAQPQRGLPPPDSPSALWLPPLETLSHEFKGQPPALQRPGFPLAAGERASGWLRGRGCWHLDSLSSSSTFLWLRGPQCKEENEQLLFTFLKPLRGRGKSSSLSTLGEWHMGGWARWWGACWHQTDVGIPALLLSPGVCGVRGSAPWALYFIETLGLFSHPP